MKGQYVSDTTTGPAPESRCQNATTASTATLFSSGSYPSTMPGMDLSRSLFIIVLIVITIAVAILLNTGTPQPETGDVTGTLAGTVTIGPLCPVEPCTISHDQIVAAYAARPITITTEGGAFVGSVTADPDNGYSISLRPGTYVVDIRHQGIGGSDLPRTVTIHAGETVRLDISIDTGIR
jgi:hypothetical protein